MLLDPGTINAINCMLGVLLTTMMTAFWLKGQRKQYAYYWMLASLFLSLASGLFLVRTWFPSDACSFIGAVAITLGMICLLAGVQQYLGGIPRWRVMLAIAACHAIGLACIMMMDARIESRMMINSVFWAGIASAALPCYYKSAREKWREWFIFPMLIFGGHAVFHALRMIVVVCVLLGFSVVSTPVLVGLSFAEATAFLATIFMSLLFSKIRLHSRKLQTALDEVQTLSGLLPICSGCKKIRDDAGYWTRLETYICDHSGAQFSHGLCPECAMTLYPDVFAGKMGDQPRPTSAKKHTVHRVVTAPSKTARKV